MKVLSLILRIAISLFSIGLVVYLMRDKLAHSAELLQKGVDWRWFWAGVTLYLVAIGFFALRLQGVFKVQEINVTFKEAAYLNFIGFFFNLIFPSAVGGDLAKVYYACKHNGNKLGSTTAVILDRLMGFFALISMCILSVNQLDKTVHDERIHHTINFFATSMVLIGIFFFSKRFARFFSLSLQRIPWAKWRQRINNIYHAIHRFRAHKTLFLSVIATSLIGQSFIILAYFCVGQSLQAQISVWMYFILVPVIFIVSMAPSLGGLGVREAGAVYLFSQLIPSEKALAITVLMDFIIYGLSIGSGILFAIKGEIKSAALKEMEGIE